MATLSGRNIQDTFQQLVQVENGLIQYGDGTNIGTVSLTGSLEASSGFVGNVVGTASLASYAATASYLTSDAVAATASYALLALTASYALSSSYEINYETSSSYAETASLAVTASNALTASYLDTYATASNALTASLAVTASNALTASYLDMYATASHALTASYLDMYATASHALTASNVNTLNQDVFITGSVNLLGNLSVIGTASFILVTASQVLVEQNTITVYGSGSALPKAGYRAVDTASISNSGSFLYDFNNRGWESSAPITASHFAGTASYAASIPTREFTATASATWWLDHNLGTEWVQVTCWDTATKRVIQPDEIEAMSTASVKITWTTPIAGVARIS